MEQQFTVREFGKALFSSPSKATGEIVQSVLREEFGRIFDALHYIRDFQWIGEAKIIEGPSLDPLGRFKSYGLYATGGSVGYDKLAEHFKCNRQHMPDRITMDFIQDIIGQYVRQEMEHGPYGYEED